MGTLLEQIDCRIVGDPGSSEISSIQYNSSKVTPGALFAALRGLKSDGHKYIKDAVKKGATAILCEEENTLPENVLQIIVKDSKAGLAEISSAFYNTGSPDFKLCAVTGTNGKTSITWLLEAISKQISKLHPAVMGTLGLKGTGLNNDSNLTTPMSPEIHEFFHKAAENNIDIIFMEASSIALEQKRLHGITFNVIIFTNLSRDHLDYHHDMETYYQAKKVIFNQLKSDGTALINIDDDYGKRLASELQKSQIRTFSLKNTEADYYYSELDINSNGITADVNGLSNELTVEAGIIGNFNASNLLAAVSAFSILYPEIISDKLDLTHFHGALGRLEIYKSQNHGNFIIDFAHTPDAMENIYKSLPRPKETTKIHSIFGAGGDRDKGKRALMGQMADIYSDDIILTDDNPRTEESLQIIKDIEKGIKEKNYKIISDRRQAMKTAIECAGTDDISIIFGKGGENYQEIGNKKFSWSDSECLLELLETIENEA